MKIDEKILKEDISTLERMLRYYTNSKQLKKALQVAEEIENLKKYGKTR